MPVLVLRLLSVEGELGRVNLSLGSPSRQPLEEQSPGPWVQEEREHLLPRSTAPSAVIRHSGQSSSKAVRPVRLSKRRTRYGLAPAMALEHMGEACFQT